MKQYYQEMVLAVMSTEDHEQTKLGLESFDEHMKEMMEVPEFTLTGISDSLTAAQNVLLFWCNFWYFILYLEIQHLYSLMQFSLGS